MDGSPGQEQGDLGLEGEGTPVALDLPSMSLDSEVPKHHQQMPPGNEDSPWGQAGSSSKNQPSWRGGDDGILKPDDLFVC